MPKKSKKSEKISIEQPYFEVHAAPQVFDPELQDDASVESVESYDSTLGSKPSIDEDLFNLLSNLREGAENATKKKKKNKAPKRKRGDESDEDEDASEVSGSEDDEKEAQEPSKHTKSVHHEGKKAMHLDRYKKGDELNAEDAFLRNFLVKAGKMTEDKEFAYDGADEVEFHFDTAKLDLVHPKAPETTERRSKKDAKEISKRTIKEAHRKKRRDDLITMLTIEERKKLEKKSGSTTTTTATAEDADADDIDMPLADEDTEEPEKEDEFDEKDDLKADLQNFDFDEETLRQIELRKKEIAEEVIAVIQELQKKFITDDGSALAQLDVQSFEDFEEKVDTTAVADEIFAPTFDPSTRKEAELNLRRRIYNLMNDYYSVYSEFATNAFRFPYKQIEKVDFGVSMAELLEMEEEELKKRAPVDTFGRKVADKNKRESSRGGRGGKRGVKRVYGTAHEKKKQERFAKFKQNKKQRTK